jgi:hypothetical protein
MNFGRHLIVSSRKRGCTVQEVDGRGVAGAVPGEQLLRLLLIGGKR